MSFSDPTNITVNAVVKALAQVASQNTSKTYHLGEAAGEYTLNIRNTEYTRKSAGAGAVGKVVDRHNVEVVHTLYAVAPATANTTRRAYFVLENEQGDTLADPTYVAKALIGLLTDPNIAKLLNNES